MSPPAKAPVNRQAGPALQARHIRACQARRPPAHGRILCTFSIMKLQMGSIGVNDHTVIPDPVSSFVGVQPRAGETRNGNRPSRPTLRKSRFAPNHASAAAHPDGAGAAEQVPQQPQPGLQSAQQLTPPADLQPAAQLHKKQHQPSRSTANEVRFIAPPTKLPSPPAAAADDIPPPAFAGFPSRLPRLKATPAAAKPLAGRAPAAAAASRAAAAQPGPETPPLLLWQVGGSAAPAAMPQLGLSAASTRICTPGFALSTDVPHSAGSGSTTSTGETSSPGVDLHVVKADASGHT